MRVDTHPASDQGRAPPRLDTQIAVVAPGARGRVAGHALEEAAIPLPGQPLDEAFVDVRVVEIQTLQPRPRAVGEGDAAHGTGDDADAEGPGA